MSKSTRPVRQDDALYRSEDVVQLADQKVFNAALTTLITESLPVGGFRHFTLYLKMLSSGSPTTLHYEVQFLESTSNEWHTYKQGPFAALYYEDEDTATETKECFVGDCAGRRMRLKITAVGTAAAKTFTVSAAVEFYN